MNCDDARHAILVVAPAALQGRTDPVLRRHLEECAECAAKADLVVADFSRLRSALLARGNRAPLRARRAPQRVVMSLVPVALAAELALFAFLGNRDAVNPILDRPVIDDTVTTLLPVIVHTEVDTGEVGRVVTASAAGDSAARADSVCRAAARAAAMEHARVVAVTHTRRPSSTAPKAPASLVCVARGDTL